MIHITCIILAKNAESIIKDCLESVKFCAEIIVIDNMSNDTTPLIAKSFGAKVIKSKIESFAGLRNVGLKAAIGKWILYVDTDERVTSSLCEEIIQYTNNPISKYSAFRIKRKNFYLGNHGWPHIECLERLFKKENLKEWTGKLHESPVVEGEIGELDGFLFHYTHRDLTSMLDKTLKWSQIEALLRFSAHHPLMTWWRFPRVMVTAFVDSYIRQGGWKVGTAGLIESVYQAFSMFITYARLWEKQHEYEV